MDLHTHCRQVQEEQAREIERLKEVNRRQAVRWERDHRELQQLRRSASVTGTLTALGYEE